MFEVDVATGLPKLPENHFWRVKLSEIAIMKRVPAGRWGDRVDSASHSGYEFETRAVEETRGWWFFKRTVTRNRMVYRSRATVREVFVRRWGVYEVFMESYNWEPRQRAEWSEHDPVTPENVVARCEETLDAWEREKATRELLGDYPPKKLAVVPSE